jgi:hypothetical protein
MKNVNVLAVMDRFTTTVLPVKLWNGANEYCGAPWREGSEYSNDLAALCEARAAIAELIDAATAMAGVQVNRRPSVRNDLGSAKKARLRAAIARATQGAPTNGK